MHKEIRNTLAYIVVATFVMITAVWQAQVAAKRDLEARHRALPPPPKTRHAVRPASQAFTGDVVADYIARCEKGMTDREIGWIVEDFQNAGLAVDLKADSPDADFLARRASQQRWYYGAMVDGLRLTPEQSSQAAAKLAECFQLAIVSFQQDCERENKAPAENAADPFSDSGSLRFNIVTATWILAGNIKLLEESPSESRAMPWDLCSLSPAQEEITWKTQLSDFRTGSTHSNLSSQPATSSPEGLKSQFRYSGPFNADDGLPYELKFSELVFPLLRCQEFPSEQPQNNSEEMRTLLLVDARRLHPAQLKILLLLFPEVAAEIQTALESASR